MATETGTVNYIQVDEVYAKAIVQNASGVNTIFLVWSDAAVVDYPASHRLVHGQWMSMLKDSYLNGTTVRVASTSGSTLISWVEFP
ncbi:MAG: hypothetical protein GY777_28830 [Candidatus Brocadiaceae bacterium]|nr:hypothetical protein [Candidatus Brocadiaceae bacterium]